MHRVSLVFFALLSGSTGSAQSHMEPYGLDLLNCSPALTTPCFRLQFKAPDMPASMQNDFTISANNRPMQVTSRRFAEGILQVTAVSPYADLASLSGRFLDFAVSWKGQDRTSADGSVRWASGDMGAVFSDLCDPTERRNAPRQWSSVPQWRPILAFLSYLGVMVLVNQHLYQVII